MNRFLISIASLAAVLGVLYFSGSKPAAPSESIKASAILPDNLIDLENQVKAAEAKVKGLKIDNEARIVWADSTQKKQTEKVFLYIHGFSASQEEGDPVAANIAKKHNANLFLTRLYAHGIDLKDSTMIDFTATKAIESVENALAISKKLGKEVHVIGTSFGGALALYLASKHPEIKSLVLYSPCIKIYDPNAELLDNNWGLKIAQTIKKGFHNDIVPKNDTQPKYWAMHYRLEALVELQNFLSHFMHKETFLKVNCPVFLGYYYKNEKEQDMVVSVPAILEMFDALGASKKVKKAFPNANNHVLASYVLSEDVENVQLETEKFYSTIL
jgi:pimeloyl-ACP methyl ester carboxylesterase